MAKQRDTNPEQRKRNSANVAATGLKTGNIRTKGENFYRDARKAKRVNMLSGKSGAAIRDARGNIVRAAEFQSTEAEPGRVQPDRRWFGNTRTISQTALEHFRTSLADKVNDPYAVVLKKNKLPMSLLTDSPSTSSTAASSTQPRMDLTTAEPFSDTFGKKAQRKRPKLDVGSIAELASSASTSAQPASTITDTLLQSGGDSIGAAVDTEQSVAPSAALAAAEDAALRHVPQDYILSAGTSKRIWAELYKVIDSSDVLLHVLDARDPLGTRCDSVEKYLEREKKGKKVIYILNKVDLVPGWAAARWVKILSRKNPTIAFHASINHSFGKGSLISLLRQFSTLMSDKKQISVGFIGYPNVGKSSIINTLKKKAVCRAAPVPGETKVWQYITLMRRIYLIDCPGIVPPSARDTDTQKVLKGIVRVEHLSSPSDHVAPLLAQVRPEYISRTYGVRDWRDADDFLHKLAAKTGKLLRGGEPDLRTVSCMVLTDWIRGRIPYFIAPPLPDGSDPKHLTPKSNGAVADMDKQGNAVKSLRGVEQPLHQVVRTTKFLADDERRDDDGNDVLVPAAAAAAADSSALEDDDDDDEEEWGGIDGLDSDNEEEDDGDEGAELDLPAAGEPPLQWDELFNQAVGEADAVSDGEVAANDDNDDDDDSEQDEDEEDDDELDVVIGKEASSIPSRRRKSTATAPLSSVKDKKRTRAIDNVSSSDSDEEPEKAPRMKTNKRKASNFYTSANVKNRRRDAGGKRLSGHSKRK